MQHILASLGDTGRAAIVLDTGAARMVVILTSLPASAMLPAMISLRQTGSGMISARMDR